MKISEYDRIDISEGIDVDKTNKSKLYLKNLKTLFMDHIFVIVFIT